MQSESPNATGKNWIYTVCFLCGFGTALMLMILTGTLSTLQKYFPQYAAIRLGRILDTDFIYLKNGNLVKARILSADSEGVLVDSSKGSEKIHASDISHIEKDYYTRYLRGIQ